MGNITAQDIIKIDLTEEEVKNIIISVKEKINIAKMDNLRFRHKNIQFDCLLRGYVGEYCIIKWLKTYDINFETTNYIQDDDSIDIDFFYKEKNLELKTSLVPDADMTINNAINRRDIKLIRRGNSNIEDLRGDIHLQIYYSQKRKAKDEWLRSQNINLESKDIDYLYTAFKARAFKSTTFFVAWIDKDTLIKRINSLPENERFWSFAGSQRFFWNCKIQDSRKPIDLVNYLRSL
jgi:hypothetical protein